MDLNKLKGDWQAGRLSRELRRARTRELSGRRTVFGLSLAASACMGVVALHQMGILRHVPGLPLPFTDGDRAAASPAAYRRLNTPDAVLSMNTHATTAVLAAMGGKSRASRAPLLPLLLVGKVGYDAWKAATRTVRQFRKGRSMSGWGLLAAGATFAMVPFAIAEAREALRHLR
jgi:hypothetical protein